MNPLHWSNHTWLILIWFQLYGIGLSDTLRRFK